MLFLSLPWQYLSGGKVPNLYDEWSHFYRPLIFFIEFFNPISRIYAPLQLHGKVHVSKPCSDRLHSSSI